MPLTTLPCQSDLLSGSDGCCPALHLSPGGNHPPQRYCLRPNEPDPSHGKGRRDSGRIAAVTEVRVPFGARQRWSLWINGRWPYLKLRFLEGAAPRNPPFVGVPAGSGPFTRGPYAAARQRPQGRPERITCVRTGAEGLSGGNWMVVHVFPVRRGCRRDRAPRAPLPFNYILPLRGSGPSVFSRLSQTGVPEVPCQ